MVSNDLSRLTLLVAVLILFAACEDDVARTQNNITPLDMSDLGHVDLFEMSDGEMSGGFDMEDLIVQPTVCQENQHVVANACVDCPKGTTNPMGDAVPGQDTTCQSILCEQNQRVQSNACQQCPAGSTNEAGDDASAENTQCDVMTCAQNQRVQNHACVDCPEDQFRRAGDDATGSDTMCGDICTLRFGRSCDQLQQGYFKASNTNFNDRFGTALAIDGDTLVVGAIDESSNARGINGDQADNSESSSGAAYVFVRVGNTWSQQAYLKPSNTNNSFLFGYAVAIDKDTIVVGARGENNDTTGVNRPQDNQNASASGAAYVFVRTGSTWSQQAYLKASNAEKSDTFGISVDVSNDTIVVGALGEDSDATTIDGDQSDNNKGNSGAAYVFVRTGNTWSQQAYLKSSNSGPGDGFGVDVAVDGDTIVVGAAGEGSANDNPEDNSAPRAGAAYVFVRAGNVWSQQAYLKASNAQAADQFGHCVALDEDTIVVGAFNEDSNATGINAAEADNTATNSGAAYVFVRTGNTWSQQAYLKASNADPDDFFGYDVAIDGDTIIVGAQNEASQSMVVNDLEFDNTAQDSGAAYIFARTGNTWAQQAYLKASNTDGGDYFGHAVALSSQMALIGAPLEASALMGVNAVGTDNTAPKSGAAYLFYLTESVQ